MRFLIGIMVACLVDVAAAAADFRDAMVLCLSVIPEYLVMNCPRTLELGRDLRLCAESFRFLAKRARPAVRQASSLRLHKRRWAQYAKVATWRLETLNSGSPARHSLYYQSEQPN